MLMTNFVSPLKIFDAARAVDRFVYASAPMVRYSKVSFRAQESPSCGLGSAETGWPSLHSDRRCMNTGSTSRGRP